jgi:hypothetical protein
MKLRQIALASSDLAAVKNAFFAVLGLKEDFADPLVTEFGLRNSVMATGNSFIEVVSPESEGNAVARFLERNDGDGGYMLIVQTASLAAASAHVEKLGIRKIWELHLDSAGAFHMHPKDTGGGAMLSFDEMDPPESWAWGGAGWEQRRADYAGDIVAVEMASAEAKTLSSRWAEIFDTQAQTIDGGYRVPMKDGEIRIMQHAEASLARIAALELAALDIEQALSAGRNFGLEVTGNSIRLCGIWLRFVQP